MLAGVIVSFCLYLFRGEERGRRLGHHLLRTALVAQGAAIGALVSGVRSMTDVVGHINPQQLPKFGQYLAQQQGLSPEQIAQLPAGRLEEAAAEFVSTRGNELFLSLNANPVELAALITAFAGTLFVIIFSFRTERLREVLPPLEKIDSLMYKLAGVTFAGLALLLMTGAIWANESWGRYWGWDSKETGAFVAWLTYGGFLHVRISRGWKGRSSAYFALVAFLLIIFTYLGVSYLLPGLHSYA